MENKETKWWWENDLKNKKVENCKKWIFLNGNGDFEIALYPLHWNDVEFYLLLRHKKLHFYFGTTAER